MNYKTSKLRDAVLLALVASGFSGAAMAQTANPQPATTTEQTGKQLDQIVVTGTRIKSQTETASSPVTEIDGEQFKLTGATRAEDLVNQQPQMSPVFDSFQNNGATGYPTVDLRGLGARRTLTLVNGNRLAPGSSFAPDISILPTAVIKRIDLLTGGASAVYGSDAIAGVVNFVLDDQFEGVNLSVGASAYQHNNRNTYIQGLMDKRGFKYPTGNSGFDGFSRNIDLVVGSSFADSAGHAMAWLTWRKNEALMQGDRDYSSCALSGNAASCGGSGTNAAGNFYIYQPGATKDDPAKSTYISPVAGGGFVKGRGNPYNYAPINYYQRPDRRYTFGAMANYKINDHFEPYVEMMYANKSDSLQFAPSGAFGTQVEMNCADPRLGNTCATYGFDATRPLNVYVYKRNIEGGPRYSGVEDSQYRILGGLRGNIMGAWDYNVSYMYARNMENSQGINDFVSTRVQSALFGCDAAGKYGTFGGCVPYNVWQLGGVTPAAAKALGATKMFSTNTSLNVLNAYVTGNIGWGFPSAGGDPISLVAGIERRVDKYDFKADPLSQIGGFTGAGGSSNPLNGQIQVNELFAEAGVPILRNAGAIKGLGLEFGARSSNYTNSQGSLSTNYHAKTWKAGFNLDMGMVRVRGGYNQAIRAPNANELFSTRSVALWSGKDPCANPLDDNNNPLPAQYTREQCLRTGVTGTQYDAKSVPANPASQYNALYGGNFNLTPEKAKTFTLGVVFLPVRNLRVNVDYYDMKLTDAISTIAPAKSLELCALNNDAAACSRIHRGSGGTLARSNAAFVESTNINVGILHYRGLDFGASYNWKMWEGNMYANFNGSMYLKRDTEIPNVDKYDCAGILNAVCSTPKWRHIANIGWRGPVGINLRWRHFGALKYQDSKGVKLTADVLVGPKGGIPQQDYFDLSASFDWRAATFNFGVNNLLDREPPMIGGDLTPDNANAIGGYDQAGRMFFTNVTFKF